MRKIYDSDITREQFETIRPLLESARKKTRPRTIDLYEVFCAVLYVLKSGCQWRMIPGDFTKWGTVYSYFKIWSEVPDNRDSGKSLLEIALKNRVSTHRIAQQRDALTAFGIVDAQNVKNTDTAKSKGYDAGKKVSGIKRHIVVDSQYNRPRGSAKGLYSK